MNIVKEIYLQKREAWSDLVWRKILIHRYISVVDNSLLAHTHTHTHTKKQTNTHTSKHTHSPTHIHTHTHTHTHAQWQIDTYVYPNTNHSTPSFLLLSLLVQYKWYAAIFIWNLKQDTYHRVQDTTDECPCDLQSVNTSHTTRICKQTHIITTNICITENTQNLPFTFENYCYLK